MENENSGLWIIDGGEVKSQESGIISGKGIVFGSPDEPDQSPYKDFFTNESFINKKSSFVVPLYYDHGIGLYDDEIGEATLTKAEDGWDAVAQLDLDNPMAVKVYEAVKESPHGFSTGALSHLVKRVSKKNKTNWLKKWPTGELSLTKRPAERKAVVQEVKCLDDYGYVSVSNNSISVTLSPDSEIEELILGMESALNLLRAFSGKHLAEDWLGVEARLIKKLEEVVKGSADTKELDGEIQELKSQLEAKEQELADLGTKFADSENALTKAKERIAQLGILAGAKEFIDKNKR